MVDILPTDEWVVRHTVGDLLVISSDAYDARQREALRRIGPGADSNYIHGIFITADGRVAGGWMLLKNPRSVILASERRTYLAPSPWGNKGWENVKFERAK